ncbi:LOW QUALITY PROTEIN: uncharacterized protein LOC114912573 [Scleropages formosus]|uniref:LOW QUALITY PROTEIN: uncharacterized protein LOC114912573 n=1 Tax=Scleropages formosus TaxID=113540 RepID=UPI003D93B3AC
MSFSSQVQKHYDTSATNVIFTLSPLTPLRCSAMQLVWLRSVCQCVMSVSVIGMSVRMCLARVRGQAPDEGGSHAITRFLRLCLGWVSAIGAAAEVPVSVALNLRSPQCLYICLTLVSWPLFVRQFTMCLLLLLALNSHLHLRLGARHASLISRCRALFTVLISLGGSVLTAFGQCIFQSVLDTWDIVQGDGTDGLGLDDGHGDDWTAPSPPVKYPMIGKYLPYGDFLSKFYVQDLENFTYAKIHGSRRGVYAPNTILSPQVLVYVYALSVFVPPLLVQMGIYLDLLCVLPKCVSTPAGPPKQHDATGRSLVLSLGLLVLLCLPFHTSHALLLFAPGTKQPPRATSVASILFQAYGLIRPLLHTPAPLHHIKLMPSTSQRKSTDAALCSTWWSCTHTRRVCPEV